MKGSLFNDDLSLHGTVCDPLACIALGVADGVAWQRDWESGSYVEFKSLIHESAKSQDQKKYEETTS